MNKSSKPSGDAIAEQSWLNIPQAVYLEATGDFSGALKITGDDPQISVLKVTRLLGWVYIPAASDSDLEAAKAQALEELTKRDGYQIFLAKLRQKLIGGLPDQARRGPRFPLEVIDPAEFIDLELSGFDAVDPRTRVPVWRNLRIDAKAHLAMLAEEVRFEPWEVKGDPLPRLCAWALSVCGGDPSKLPGRRELLRLFRRRFGRVRGISEHTMREVRRRLVPGSAKKGGSPMHRR
jgi:hypothetical protein